MITNAFQACVELGMRMVFVLIVMKIQLVKHYTCNLILVSMNVLKTLNLLMDHANLTVRLELIQVKVDVSLVLQDVQNAFLKTFVLFAKTILLVI